MSVNPFTEKTKEILCSLAVIPATLPELIERDFLKSMGGYDEYATFTLLNSKWAQKYWYEDRNGVFHIYAKYREDVQEHVFK